MSRGFTAELLGISRRFTQFTSPTGAVWLTRNATLAYPFVDYGVHKLTEDKQLSYEFADLHGVTVPKTVCLQDLSEAAESFLTQNKPIVVKPLNSFGSKGLSLNVTDQSGLEVAFEYAKAVSDHVLLQQQVSGDEVRLTVVEGRVVSALLRQTARLVGDGRTTITELLARENQDRSNLRTTYITYPRLDEQLISDSYFNDQTVLADGEVEELNKSTLVRGGASLYEITHELHDDYKEIAERLAKALNPAFLVIDLMIDDYSQPRQSDNYAFIEFNTAPSLKMYYGVRGGKEYDMVTRLTDMIEARIA